MWDLPRPGLEPVSPALAGRFLNTAPPGKPPDIIILNVYEPNKRVSKYVRQKILRLQGEIDESTIAVENFNTPLSEMG